MIIRAYDEIVLIFGVPHFGNHAKLTYAAAKSEEDVSYFQEYSITDPEIVELKNELKNLKNSIQKLTSVIKMEEAVRQLKEINKEEIEEVKSKSE